ncbi:YigZ family protein [Alteromonas sp. V450]|uniref:YigZ family protein n=1 Tax=Alteromonas sp. V450 TaxID=1912139 RepID=UPI0008FF3DAB|nr:YigZ family protein [Alteromonas sp. V450]OJF70590.1 YigZ family protein [Alteromonas sp. V450]
MVYPVPANQVETLYEIKKSKFIACAGFANSRESAMALLESVKQQYPDARHHCWAYIFGNPNAPSSAAMADDGEPSGTAGKPILNVLQHKDIGDIMIIVTRYFGGVKLGAGGLVRAYSAAAQQAIDALEVRQEITLEPLSVAIDFKHEQFVRHLVEQAEGNIANCSYGSRVEIDVALPVDALNDFKKQMAPIAFSVSAKNK